MPGAYRYFEIEDLVHQSDDGPGLLVVLDSVSDPHNLGAVVRSAHMFGANGVVIPRDRAASVTPVVTKVSAGATEHVAIAQVTNLSRALETVKEAGYWTVAVHAAADSVPLWSVDAEAPVCLVLGAEGRGIRPPGSQEVRLERCDSDVHRHRRLTQRVCGRGRGPVRDRSATDGPRVHSRSLVHRTEPVPAQAGVSWRRRA